ELRLEGFDNGGSAGGGPAVAVASGSALTAAPQALQKRLLGGTSEPQETQRREDIPGTGNEDDNKFPNGEAQIAGMKKNAQSTTWTALDIKLGPRAEATSYCCTAPRPYQVCLR